MPGWANAAKNAMLDSEAASSAYLSLHTADPGATGANEVTGGSPAYARIALTWAAASAGSKAISNAPQFNVPAGTVVGFFGLWTAVTAGTFRGGGPLGSATAFVGTGVASTDFITAPGTAYTATQTVVLSAAPGAAVPTGLTAGTIYYVSAPSGDTFKLAATSGGTAIDITADGDVIVQGITTETYGGQGTYTVSALTVSM